MQEKYIWDFLQEKPYLSHLTGAKPDKSMLDLGFRHGNSLYHCYHQFGFSHCEGLDLSSLEFIANADTLFWNQYNDELEFEVENIRYRMEFSDSLEKLFTYYKLICDKIIKVAGIRSTDEFLKTFSLHFETDMEAYLASPQGRGEFDLVILGKVLHFFSVKNPQQVIEQALESVKTGGILFVKTWIKTYPDGRRRDMYLEEVRSWMKGMEILEVIQEGELAYIFIKK